MRNSHACWTFEKFEIHHKTDVIRAPNTKHFKLPLALPKQENSYHFRLHKSIPE